jgi:hypothetical protein
LSAKVKMALTIMWSKGTNARCPPEHRADQYQEENNMSFLGELSSRRWSVIDNVTL